VSVQLNAAAPAVTGLFSTMYRRAVRETRRIILVVTAVPLIVPIFMLVVFSNVFASIMGTAGLAGAPNYVTYIAPGAMLMAVMLSATGAVSVAVERQTGFYDRMRISPRGPRYSNLARRVADATKLFMFAFVLVIVSFLAGASTEHWLMALVVGTVIPTLWGFVYGGFSFALCLRTGKAELAEAVLPAFFPLIFVSSAFVPMALLPTWMETVARYNPLTYLVDTIRQAYLGDVRASSLGWAILSIVAVGVASQLLVMEAERKVARTR
jgi:ABC-2 type transport system permease protein